MFRVRPFKTYDIGQVVAVNRRCFSAPWSAWAIQYDAERNPNSFWLVLEREFSAEKENLRWLRWFKKAPPAGQIIGFGAFWLLRGEAHITSIGVDPDYRGSGWGEVLVISILQRAIALGADFSSLEVRVSNQQAINLYKKYAYRIVGHKAAYYHDNREDAHLMSTGVFDSTYIRLIEQRVATLSSRLHWKDTFTRSVSHEA